MAGIGGERSLMAGGCLLIVDAGRFVVDRTRTSWIVPGWRLPDLYIGSALSAAETGQISHSSGHSQCAPMADSLGDTV